MELKHNKFNDEFVLKKQTNLIKSFWGGKLWKNECKNVSNTSFIQEDILMVGQKRCSMTFTSLIKIKLIEYLHIDKNILFEK